MKSTKCTCTYCDCWCHNCEYNHPTINPECPYKSCWSIDWVYEIWKNLPKQIIVECCDCSRKYKVFITYDYI